MTYDNKYKNYIYIYILTGNTFVMHAKDMIQSHLVSKQDHDGVAACPRRSVFDSECVIVISNYVKINVSLCGSHYSGSTLDSYADVTWEQEKGVKTHVQIMFHNLSAFIC